MLISFIVPVFNTEKFLDRCIDSILNQSCPDFECILVDDGSSDGSLKKCEQYCDKDSRIKVIHKENGGVTSARKAGVEASEGEYIIFVDSDDDIEKETVRLCKDVHDKYNPEVISFRGRRYGAKASVEMRSLHVQEGIYESDDIKKLADRVIRSADDEYFSFSLCFFAVKRETVNKYLMPLNDEIKIGEDACVALPCQYFAKSLFYLDRALYNYRFNVESTMHKPQRIEDTGKVVAYLKKVFSEELPDFDKQISRYVALRMFSFSMSYMYSGAKYKDIKNKVLKNIDTEETRMYLKNADFNSPRQRFKVFLLRHRLIWVMWLGARFIRA